MAHDKKPALLGVSWVLLSLVVITIGLRISTRINVIHQLSSDDYLMVLAGLLQVVSTAFVTLSVHYGLGVHLAEIPNPEYNIPALVKANWEGQTPGILASVIARISIAILLARLFGIRRWFRWYVYTVTALQSFCECLLIIVVWAQCRPVEALWNPSIPHKCWDPEIELAFAYLGQAVFTLSDLTFVLFPVLFLWQLNMKTERKIGLIAVFTLGLLTMTASIIKILHVQSSSITRDPTWYEADAILWANVEQTLVIIMGNIPALRAFPRHQFNTLRSLGSAIRLRSWRSRNTSGNDVTTTKPPTNENGAYQDLELQGQKNLQNGHFISDSVSRLDSTVLVFPNKDDNSSASYGDNIVRDDTYEVSYETKATPKGAI